MNSLNIDKIFKLPTFTNNAPLRKNSLFNKKDYDEIQKFFVSWDFIKIIVKERFKAFNIVSPNISLYDFDNFIDTFSPDLNFFYYPMYTASSYGLDDEHPLNSLYFFRLEKWVWLLCCNIYLPYLTFWPMYNRETTLYEQFKLLSYHIVSDHTCDKYIYDEFPPFGVNKIKSGERLKINNVFYVLYEIDMNVEFTDNYLSPADFLDLQRERNEFQIETYLKMGIKNRYLKAEFNMDSCDILFYNFNTFFYDLNIEEMLLDIENEILDIENGILEKGRYPFLLDEHLGAELFSIPNIIIFFSNISNNHKYYFVPIKTYKNKCLTNEHYFVKKKFKPYYETKSLGQQSAELIFDKLYLDSRTAEDFKENLIKSIDRVNKFDFLRSADSSFFMVEHFFMSEYKKYTNSSENFEKNISIDHIDNVLNIMLWRLEKYEVLKIFCKNTREYFGNIFKFFYVLKVPI